MQRPRERQRVSRCAITGVGVAAVGAATAGWQLGVLVGWLVTAGSFLGLVGLDLRGTTAARTAAMATSEDPGHRAARGLVLVASVASIVAVLVGLRRAGQVDGALEVALTAASLATVFVSWATVHTVFMLRYAALYYGGVPGGIDFPGDEAPDYLDFLYVAFGIGMTFQVADTDITSRAVRRTMVAHMALAFVFSAVIVAVTINVVASLL